MNWLSVIGWAERAGFLLLAWHVLALTVSLSAWGIIGGLRRQSCSIRSQIARAALLVAVLAPAVGLVVNAWSKKTPAPIPTEAAVAGERVWSAPDWDKVAVWKPLLAKVDFSSMVLPTDGKQIPGARQPGLSLFALLTGLLFLRGLICLRSAWREKNRLLSMARRADAGQLSAYRQAATMMTALPELRFCAVISGPMLVGVFKPVLLLPDESFIREAVLLHECTHWQRRDTLWRALALILRRCAPLQFGFALLHRAMCRADEEICDDAVIARGTGRAAYAQLLLTMAEQKYRGGEFALSMAAMSQLEQRVRRLLNAAWSPIGKVSPLWTVAIVIGAAVLTGIGGWAYADAGKACGKKELPSPSTTTGEDLTIATLPASALAARAIIREITVDYAGPKTMPAEQVIGLSGLTVGGECDEHIISWAVKHLYQTQKFRNLRINSEPAGDGVKVNITVQPWFKLRAVHWQGTNVGQRLRSIADGRYIDKYLRESLDFKDEYLFDLGQRIKEKIPDKTVKVYWTNQNEAEGLADITVNIE